MTHLNSQHISPTTSTEGPGGTEEGLSESRDFQRSGRLQMRLREEFPPEYGVSPPTSTHSQTHSVTARRGQHI